MKLDTDLTKEDFDILLAWLDSNQEKAGFEYEKIRQGLIRYFYFKGCADGEVLADETINRVCKKITKLQLNSNQKPITIFYGFASNIYFEELRRAKSEVTLDKDYPVKPIEKDEARQNCLDKCLGELDKSDKELLIQYYSKDKSDKFEHRRKLAENLGLTANTMHVKLHRLRILLKGCIEKCLENKNNL